MNVDPKPSDICPLCRGVIGFPSLCFCSAYPFYAKLDADKQMECREEIELFYMAPPYE